MPASMHRSKLASETWVLIAAILGSSMAFIDGTVVNIALPALRSSLHASGAELQWVVEAYALFLAALLLVCGSMSDVFGRRLIFILGTILFAAASAIPAPIQSRDRSKPCRPLRMAARSPA